MQSTNEKGATRRTPLACSFPARLRRLPNDMLGNRGCLMRPHVSRRDIPSCDRTAVLSDGLLTRHSLCLGRCCGNRSLRPLNNRPPNPQKGIRESHRETAEDLRRCFTKEAIWAYTFASAKTHMVGIRNPKLLGSSFGAYLIFGCGTSHDLLYPYAPLMRGVCVFWDAVHILILNGSVSNPIHRLLNTRYCLKT